jgi:hypothetical protein
MTSLITDSARKSHFVSFLHNNFYIPLGYSVRFLFHVICQIFVNIPWMWKHLYHRNTDSYPCTVRDQNPNNNLEDNTEINVKEVSILNQTCRMNANDEMALGWNDALIIPLQRFIYCLPLIY